MEIVKLSRKWQEIKHAKRSAYITYKGVRFYFDEFMRINDGSDFCGYYTISNSCAYLLKINRTNEAAMLYFASGNN